MTETRSSSAEVEALTLVVRRTLSAPPKRVFEAWTRAALLQKWWGPGQVTCPEAEVDLRVGGSYRIANRFPDGKVMWIHGVFEQIEAPKKLVYTWGLGDAPSSERVTVQFEERSADGTEVIITHERITSHEARVQHEHGWFGCLDGLETLVGGG